MRIPLDYYRILGIPIQVTDEQIHQAYQDRSLQLPRREYSHLAIQSRKQLLDEAYQVLLTTEKRTAYDVHFLNKAYAIIESSSENPHIIDRTEENSESFSDNNSPWIDVSSEQVVGALLILQELGEYELVIQIGETHLLQITDVRHPTTIEADTLLSIALAYLELSREQWQHKEYEKAAISAQKGSDLLKQEQLFPNVVEEIQADFYKLRPYRILELLALDLDRVTERQEGLDLLKAMLQERQGVDGKGNDRSGLGIDDFLRFIQQLRTYLTVEEQQNLFEAETEWSSAVTTYLNVYALIARGFARKQPAFIVKASEALKHLSKRQDVHIEQAICALLLGQTELASLTLEKSQDVETLGYIKEQSQGASDLLLGLCRYGEMWLQTEVFAHFRDLTHQNVSLKDYFADEAVQDYLEALSEDLPEKEQSLTVNLSTEPLESEVTLIPSEAKPEYSTPARGALTMRESTYSYSQSFGKPELTRVGSAKETAMASTNPVSSRQRLTRPDRSVKAIEYTTQGNLVVTSAYRQPSIESPRRRRKPQGVTRLNTYSDQIPATLPVPRKKTHSKRKKFHKGRLLFLGVVALGGVAACAMAVRALQESFSPLSALQGEQLAITLDRPPLEIPPANAQIALPGTLTKEGAEEVIQTWLLSKAQALGTNHQVEQLGTILVEPILSVWQNRANTLKGTNNYWDYQHQVQIQTVTNHIQDPNQATIEASVQEKAKYYQNGQVISSRSYDDNLLVRYDLIRKSEQWFIQNIQVLK